MTDKEIKTHVSEQCGCLFAILMGLCLAIGIVLFAVDYRMKIIEKRIQKIERPQ